MTPEQRKSMIKFHEKTEAAYRRFGQKEKAEQAKKMREDLERQESEARRVG
jgi:hypothetical protein